MNASEPIPAVAVSSVAPDAEISFTAADPLTPPTPATNGILAAVGAVNGPDAASLTQALENLIADQDSLIAWLGRDASNAAAFATDPAAAIVAALGRSDALDEIQRIAKRVPIAGDRLPEVDDEASSSGLGRADFGD